MIYVPPLSQKTFIFCKAGFDWTQTRNGQPSQVVASHTCTCKASRNPEWAHVAVYRASSSSPSLLAIAKRAQVRWLGRSCWLPPTCTPKLRTARMIMD